MGEEAKHVIDQLVNDNWTLVACSEIGAEFKCFGKWLVRGAPTFADYPRLVIVMSADHDSDMGFNHLLHVEEHGHQVSRCWPCDPERDEELEAIESDATYQETDMALNAAESEEDAMRERENFLRHMREMEADDERNQDRLIDSDSPPSSGEESLDEAKTRWDRAIGMTSLSCGNNRFVFCSPTGFPLADMELNQNDAGRFEASFGHPIAMQNDWLQESKP